MGKLGPSLMHFFFPRASSQWLTILRCGLALQVILYCLSAWADWQLFYSTSGNGLIRRDLAEAILSAQSVLVPRFGWLVVAGERLGISEELTLQLAWLLLLCAGLCLLAGFFCRSSAVLAWLLHLCAAKSGTLTSYGMDNFTTIGLFYLMIAPLPDRFSIDARIRRRPAGDPRLHGFYRRVLQIHLCLTYFFGGLTKAFGPAWWNGDSIWRALTRPPFNHIPATLLASWGGLLSLLGIGVWLLEVTYPVFIWPKGTRYLWLASMLALHLSIGLTMGLYLFALVMIVLNLAAFAPDLIARRSSAKS